MLVLPGSCVSGTVPVSWGMSKDEERGSRPGGQLEPGPRQAINTCQELLCFRALSPVEQRESRGSWCGAEDRMPHVWLSLCRQAQVTPTGGLGGAEQVAGKEAGARIQFCGATTPALSISLCYFSECSSPSFLRSRSMRKPVSVDMLS